MLFLIKAVTQGFEKTILVCETETLLDTSLLIIDAQTLPITDNAVMVWQLGACLPQEHQVRANLIHLIRHTLYLTFWRGEIVFPKSTWFGAQVIQFGL